METKESKALVKKQYISILLAWAVYVSAYFGRYSYSANIALMEQGYGGAAHTNAEAGLVMTFFAITYGAGQIIHGILCRRYSRRFAVPAVLTVSGAVNLLIFIGVPFGAVKYLWMLNAACQSVLWSLIMQIISENVGERLMHKAVLAMSTTTSFGTLFIYAMSAWFAKSNYLMTFFVSSIVLVSSAVIWMLFYRPGDFLKNAAHGDEPGSAKKPFDKASLLAPIILLLIFSFLVNFNKDGLQTWVPVILKNLHGMRDEHSILLTLILPLFGVFGSSAAVLTNKKIKSILAIILIFSGFTALFNTAVILFKNSLVITLVCFGFLELFLHGASSAIVSIFPLAMREKISSGLLAGILDGSAYLGSGISSYALGKIADVTGGWNSVFATLLGSACSILIFGGVYMIASKHKAVNARASHL